MEELQTLLPEIQEKVEDAANSLKMGTSVTESLKVLVSRGWKEAGLCSFRYGIQQNHWSVCCMCSPV